MRRRHLAVTLSVVATALGIAADVSPAVAAHSDIEVYGHVDVAGPTNLIKGPDGMVWFTSTASDRIARLDPDAADPAASITTYTEVGLDAPWDLVAGPDGNIWFTADGAVGSIVPDTGAITLHPDANIDDGRGITVGPDDNLWFTSQANDRIGVVTTAGTVTTFTNPGIDAPSGIASLPAFEAPTSPPDAVWFANTGGDDLGRVALPSVTIDFVEVTGLDDPVQIETVDADIAQGLAFNSTANDRMGGCNAFGDCGLDAAPLLDGLGSFADDDTANVARWWVVGLDDDVLHAVANAEAHDFTSEDVVDPSALLPLGGDQLWFTMPSTDQIGRLEVDGIEPTATITSPVDGATYTRGALPALEFTCADEVGGAGMDECASEYGPSGSSLPDDGIGPYSIQVGARDGFGNLGTDRVDITVVGTTTCDGLPATIELAHGDDPSRIDDDVIVGTPGDDVIDAGWGEDVICGNGGNDVITTGPFPDRVFGGEGDDQVVTGDQADEVDGGSGDDEIDGGEGDDDLFGGSGVDVVQGGPGEDDLFGGFGEDDLLGGIDDDDLDGGNDDDLLRGEDGDDALSGSNGNDVLHGGTGDDHLGGNRNDDDLHGGAGRDTAFGGAGTDRLWGEADRDRLDGGDGHDQLRGGSGSSNQVGGKGNDLLVGGSDTDVLDGGDHRDHLLGGGANDVLLGRDDVDLLEAGDGNDRLDGGNQSDTCRGQAGIDRSNRCEVRSGIP